MWDRRHPHVRNYVFASIHLNCAPSTHPWMKPGFIPLRLPQHKRALLGIDSHRLHVSLVLMNHRILPRPTHAAAFTSKGRH